MDGLGGVHTPVDARVDKARVPAGGAGRDTEAVTAGAARAAEGAGDTVEEKPVRPNDRSSEDLMASSIAGKNYLNNKFGVTISSENIATYGDLVDKLKDPNFSFSAIEAESMLVKVQEFRGKSHIYNSTPGEHREAFTDILAQQINLHVVLDGDTHCAAYYLAKKFGNPLDFSIDGGHLGGYLTQNLTREVKGTGASMSNGLLSALEKLVEPPRWGGRGNSEHTEALRHAVGNIKYDGQLLPAGESLAEHSGIKGKLMSTHGSFDTQNGARALSIAVYHYLRDNKVSYADKNSILKDAVHYFSVADATGNLNAEDKKTFGEALVHHRRLGRAEGIDDHDIIDGAEGMDAFFMAEALSGNSSGGSGASEAALEVAGYVGAGLGWLGGKMAEGALNALLGKDD